MMVAVACQYGSDDPQSAASPRAAGDGDPAPMPRLGLMRSTRLMGWPLLASQAPSYAVGSMGSADRATNGSSTSVASIRHGLIGSASGWTSATLRSGILRGQG